MKELLDKFSAMAGQSESECKVASTISTACQLVRNSTVTVQTKKVSGVGASLFQSAKLDFSNETKEEADSKFLKALSFLIIFKCHNDELQLLRTSDGNVAPQPPLLVNLGIQSEKPKAVPKSPQKESKPQAPSNAGVKPKKIKTLQTKQAAGGNNETIKNGNSEPLEKVQEAAKMFAKNASVKNFRLKMAPKNPSLQDTKLKSASQGNLCQINMSPLDGLKLNTKIDKCYLTFSVNGMVYGKVVVQLRPDVAPIMCQKFAHHCSAKKGQSYTNTIINSVIIYDCFECLMIIDVYVLIPMSYY